MKENTSRLNCSAVEQKTTFAAIKPQDYFLSESIAIRVHALETV